MPDSPRADRPDDEPVRLVVAMSFALFASMSENLFWGALAAQALVFMLVSVLNISYLSYKVIGTPPACCVV